MQGEQWRTISDDNISFFEVFMRKKRIFTIARPPLRRWLLPGARVRVLAKDTGRLLCGHATYQLA